MSSLSKPIRSGDSGTTIGDCPVRAK